jgi:hypothetical protein
MYRPVLIAAFIQSSARVPLEALYSATQSKRKATLRRRLYQVFARAMQGIGPKVLLSGRLFFAQYVAFAAYCLNEALGVAIFQLGAEITDVHFDDV